MFLLHMQIMVYTILNIANFIPILESFEKAIIQASMLMMKHPKRINVAQKQHLEANKMSHFCDILPLYFAGIPSIEHLLYDIYKVVSHNGNIIAKGSG